MILPKNQGFGENSSKKECQSAVFGVTNVLNYPKTISAITVTQYFRYLVNKTFVVGHSSAILVNSGI